MVSAWLLATTAASCTDVPPHAYPPAKDFEVEAFYAFDAGPTPVRVPASNDDLQVLHLETEPSDLRESFASGERHLHPDGASLTVRCRYRVFERRDADGRLRPQPTPSELFPEATSLQTLSPAK